MRTPLLALVVLSLLVLVPCGCTDKKPAAADSLQNDSLSADTATADSTELIIEETPMPKAADELFDDFIFNFTANRKLQLQRVKFPLPVCADGKESKKLQKNQWRTERLFIRQGYYTLIFNNDRQLGLVKDTTVSHATVERIQLKVGKVQQFVFDRINGQWMLTSINNTSLKTSPNADFLRFYQHFATDSAFQQQSIADEVRFTAPDPNDDFSSISGIMMPQQWPDFKPSFIPSGTIYNILYGQTYKQSSRRTFLIRGIANGLEIEMCFRKMSGAWWLVKFSC